jgi:hypothetical protein
MSIVNDWILMKFFLIYEFDEELIFNSNIKKH